MLLHEVKSNARLHVYLAERVRQHVVKFPSDAHAFGLQCGLFSLLPRATELVDVLVPSANCLANAHHDEDAEGRARNPHRVPVNPEGGGKNDRNHPSGSNRNPGPDPCTARNCADDCERESDVRRAMRRVANEEVGRRSRGDDGNDRPRILSGSDQGKWPDDGCCDTRDWAGVGELGELAAPPDRDRHLGNERNDDRNPQPRTP